VTEQQQRRSQGSSEALDAFPGAAAMGSSKAGNSGDLIEDRTGDDTTGDTNT